MSTHAKKKHAIAILFAAGLALVANFARADVYVSTLISGSPFQNASVLQYSNTGTLLGTYQDAGSYYVGAGLALSPDHKSLYLSAQSLTPSFTLEGTIQKFDLASHTFSTFAVLPNTANPGTLRFGSDGNLYVGQQAGPDVFVYNPNSATPGTPINTIAAAYAVGGLVAGPAGLYVTDFVTGDVRLVPNPATNTTYDFTTVTPETTIAGERLGGLMLHDNTLYISDYSGNKIFEHTLGSTTDPTSFSTTPPAIPTKIPGDSSYTDPATNSPFGMYADLTGTGFFVAAAGPSSQNPQGFLLHYDWNGNLLDWSGNPSSSALASGLWAPTDVAAVPEPATWILASLALVTVLWVGRRRRQLA